jgi:hypothetical protein
MARVTPVVKSKDPTEFSNDQLIKVLPVLSQLFERVLYVRMLGFLNLQEVNNAGQYGFRSGHSSAMVIQDMVERVRGAWDSKRAALGVFTDLKKAIDTGSSFQNWGFIWRVGFSMWHTTGVSQVGG